MILVCDSMGEVSCRHIPLESVMSKWYGESERRLNSILQLCNKIDNCVIFIDEVVAMETNDL